MSPELKFLAKCKPRELVRVKVEDAGQWALVGKPDRQYWPIILLSGCQSPLAINVLEGGSVSGDFETYAVLSFGTTHTLRPNYTARCELGVGQLFKKPGAFILSETDEYLIVTEANRQRWFDLRTGAVRGEPGGKLAAFASWELRVEDLIDTTPALLVHTVS